MTTQKTKKQVCVSVFVSERLRPNCDSFRRLLVIVSSTSFHSFPLLKKKKKKKQSTCVGQILITPWDQSHGQILLGKLYYVYTIVGEAEYTAETKKKRKMFLAENL